MNIEILDFSGMVLFVDLKTFSLLGIKSVHEYHAVTLGHCVRDQRLIVNQSLICFESIDR